jgi:hypothetical protein
MNETQLVMLGVLVIIVAVAAIVIVFRDEIREYNRVRRLQAEQSKAAEREFALADRERAARFVASQPYNDKYWPELEAK